jgi:hypothetical protein
MRWALAVERLRARVLHLHAIRDASYRSDVTRPAGGRLAGGPGLASLSLPSRTGLSRRPPHLGLPWSRIVDLAPVTRPDAHCLLRILGST